MEILKYWKPISQLNKHIRRRTSLNKSHSNNKVERNQKSAKKPAKEKSSASASADKQHATNEILSIVREMRIRQTIMEDDLKKFKTTFDSMKMDISKLI